MNTRPQQQSDTPKASATGNTGRDTGVSSELEWQSADRAGGAATDQSGPGPIGIGSQMVALRNTNADAQGGCFSEHSKLSSRIRTLETLLIAERRRAEQATKAAANRIAELERESSDRAGAIQHLQGALSHAMFVAHERAQSIEALLKSTSWKISAPVRMLGRLRHGK